MLLAQSQKLGSFVNYSLVRTHSAVVKARQQVTDKFDSLLVRYDAWFLVLMAVLLAISVVVATALAVWCVTYQGKRFTGRWQWGKWYVSVWAECR